MRYRSCLCSTRVEWGAVSSLSQALDHDYCMVTGTTDQPRVIDLFSGIGGLSHGFVLEGFDVVAGIDIDEKCKYGFEKNNRSKFIAKDIAQVTPRELKALYENSFPKVLIGCAPCTPFSTLTLNRAVYIK